MGRVRVPWTSQPQQPTGIDWDNPITRGLEFVVCGDQIANPAKGSLLTIDRVGLTQVVGLKGKGFKFAGGSTNSGRLRGVVTDTPANTFIVLVGDVNSFNGGTGNTGRFISTFNGSGGHDLYLGGSNGLQFQVFATTTNGNYAPDDSRSVNWTTPRCYGYSFDGVIGNAPVIFRDGAPSVLYTYTAASGTRIAGGTNCDVGARPDVNTRQGAFTNYLSLRFNRALSTAELATITANPWQVFAPLERRIWAPAAGGGTTITGTIGTAVASGLRGTVNTNRAIAGALGTATASGFQGVVNANRTISGVLGTAVASGLTGNVNANRTIAGALGTATASGFQGTVTNGNTTTITGSLGTAVATGFTGGVAWNRYIAGLLGVATASGFTGGVANGTAAPAQEGGGWMPPQGRRKTRKEVYAERVKLGILPPAIVRAAEKVAVVAETVAEFKADRPRYEEMFMRELNVTKWAPSYTNMIMAQLVLLQEEEDLLLLM